MELLLSHCVRIVQPLELPLFLQVDGLVHFIVTWDTQVDKAAWNHAEKLKKLQQHRPQWRCFQTVPED